MPITPEEVKLVLPQAEFVRTITPTGTTEITKRVGIGGLVRTKFLTHAITADLEGDVTSPKLLKALLGNTEMTIGIHDLEVSGALAESFEIGVSGSDPVTFSASLQARNIQTITPGTPTLPDELFTKAEGVIAINKAPTEVEELTVSAERSLEPVYGGTGSTISERMKPTSFKIGTWEYSGDITVPPATISDMITLWDPTQTKWTIVAQFVDAVDNTHTFGFVLRGVIVSESSGDISAEEITASRTFEAESFEVGEVKVDSFTGDGTTTNFSLSGTPLEDSVLAKVDGTYVTNFSASGSTVTFDSAPANGASIEISYLVEVAL